MNAKLITHQEKENMVTAWVPSVKDAAKALGVSESTVRKAARKLGVKQVSGRSVAGFVLFERHPVSVSLSYFR